MLRQLLRKRRVFVAILQILALVIALVAPAYAATSPSSADLMKVLTNYGIVRGDEKGNLNLDKPITRAEMITIMVRATGRDDDAPLFKNMIFFNDVQGHWAEGYINLAAARKLVKGDGNGFARPQDPISWAEALTLLLRVVDREPSSGSWPVNVLLTAAELGLLPPGVSASTIRESAIRGPIFTSLATAVTTLEKSSGQTYLQAYVDGKAPVLSVNSVTSPTKDDRVKLSGTATDAHSVLVNGKAATLSGNSWSSTVELDFGTNTIDVVAKDLAGNSQTKSVTVERTPPVSRIEFSGPAKVQKGTSAIFTVKAYDQDDKAATLTGATVKVDGNIGNFNLQSNSFTASSQAGKGKITISIGNVSASVDVEVVAGNPNASMLRIRPINQGRSVSITKEMLVQVEVLDSNSNFLSDDNGRDVSLTATGLQGLTVTPSTAQTVNGVASFRIRSSQVGAVNLTVSSTGLTPTNAVASFGTQHRIQLSADPSSLVVGGSTSTARIRGTLVDENNNPISNTTDSHISIQLAMAGTDSYLTDPYLTILRGASTTSYGGDEGLVTVGVTSGTARISGAVTSGQNYTVEPADISITAPQISASSAWDIIFPVSLQPNTPATFYVRLTDVNGATIPGSFAFQFEASTSNNETKTNGIPQGLSITTASGQNPISDGISEGSATDTSDVVVRTVGGSAAFTISYDKVGQVDLKVVGMPATTTAYAGDGTVGTATSGAVVPNKTFAFKYTTTPSAIQLTADSTTFGNDQTIGAVSSSGSQSFKVRARFTDGARWIPGVTGQVTLERVSGTSTIEPSVKTINVVDGKAEFTVVSNGTPGSDVYRVTGKRSDGSSFASPSNTVTLWVQNQAPGSPTVLAARGMNGVTPGAWYYVAPTDTNLDLELATNGAPGWGVVNVYQVNYSTPFFTSQPLDLTASTVRISIPKDKLPSGRMQYQVTFKNAVGETSPRALTPEYVTNATIATNITVSSAKYDRTTGKLHVYGSGFGTSTGSNPDTAYPNLLTITDASLYLSNPAQGQISLSGAVVEQIAYNYLVLNVSSLAASLNLMSGADVSISGSTGWYVRYTGEVSAAVSSKPVTPMAAVQYVTYDRANRRLVLVGSGFTTGTVAQSLLKVSNGVTEYSLSLASSYRISDSEWGLSLSSLPSVETALQGDASYQLFGSDGWFAEGSVRQNQIANISIYDRISVSSVAYDSATRTLTINGSGLTGWTVDPTKLQVVDMGQNPSVTVGLTGTFLAGSSTDTQLKIQLNDPSPLGSTLTGSNLYLTGSAGWATNATGPVVRTAAPIPLWVLLLPPQ